MVNWKYHFFFILILGIFPLNAQVKIEGEFLNADNYHEVYLYEFFGRNLFIQDTFELRDGKFEMNFDHIDRGFYRVGIEGNKMINLILGNESFSFRVDLEDPFESMVFENSIENDSYKKYLDFSVSYASMVQSINSEMNEIFNQPDSLQDTIQLGILNERRDSLDRGRLEFLMSTKNIPGELYIKKIATASIYENDADNFFSENDLNDEEMTRGDMLSSKLFYYFQNHVPANLADWQKAIDTILEKSSEGRMQEFYAFTFVELVGMVAPNHVWDIAAPYFEEYANSKYFQALESRLPPKTLGIGDQAPEISLTDPAGNIIHLSSLKGNVVLIDFWASWCGPCRKENPNVVRAYQAFKDHGFTVYGVSLDRDKDRWLKAIERDQLTWHHVSDLKGWKNEGAATYGVRAIPAAFLVDQEGKIIAKNLRGEQLHNKLKEIFDQK